MQAPSGDPTDPGDPGGSGGTGESRVSSSFRNPSHVPLPDEDPTFAPPPMSAYSIAVFSNYSAATPVAEEGLIGKKYDWKYTENAALKELLKQKLSVHFNSMKNVSTTLPAASPPQEASAGRSPATRYSSTLSSNGVHGTNHSFGGITGTTSYASNTSGEEAHHSSSKHRLSGSRSATFSSGHIRRPEAEHIGLSAQQGNFSKSFDGVLETEADSHSHKGSHNGSHSISWSQETPDLGARSHISTTSASNSLRRTFPQVPAIQSPERHEEPPLAGAAPLRPSSSGTLIKRSRISRRFRSLGPPKRASEQILAAMVSPEQNESDRNGEISLASGLHSATAISTANTAIPAASATSTPPAIPLASSKPDAAVNDNSSVRSRVSPNSDFFKSLKKLKETPPRQILPDTDSYRRLNSPSYPTDASITKREVGPVSADVGTSRHSYQGLQSLPSSYQNSNQNSNQNSLSRNASRLRQPLRDVSPGLLNSGRVSGEFKKPRLPGALVAEKRTMPQDPTPQAPSQTARSVAEPARLNSSRSNDDRRKKVICVNSKEYEKLEILGRGGSSKVYKVRSLSDKKAYALKKVSFDQFDESCVRGFKGEIDLLMRLKKEMRVVSLVDHAASSGSLYLLMECGDLDLAHVLQNKLVSDATLDTNFVRFHASEVFHCIKAVHNAGIVHSDLKPANFLFVGGILKIIDFGIANAVPDHTVNIYRHSQIGTPNYMAPEALVEVNQTAGVPSRSQGTTWKVGRPSDIWSCGCIVYQMIYGRPPYAAYSGQQRIMAIMNPQVKVQYPATGLGGVAVPLSAIELMKKCLERNPNDRWTVDECLDSDFLRPKAVNEDFVRELLQNAVTLGHRSGGPESIDDRTYNELVKTILSRIKDLNFA